MPQNLVDHDDFTPTIVAPADGDLRNAASVVVGLQGLTNRTYALAVVAEQHWARLDELEKRVSFDAVRRVGLKRFTSGDEGVCIMDSGELILSGGNTRYGADITSDLPVGATIVSIEVRVTPGTSRSGTNRMYCELQKLGSFSSGTYSVVGPVYDNGTTNAQVLTVSVNEVVATDTQYTIAVKCGNNALASNDRLHAVRFTISFP